MGGSGCGFNIRDEPGFFFREAFCLGGSGCGFSIREEPGRPFLFLPLTMMMALCPEAVRFFVFFALRLAILIPRRCY